MPKAHNRTLTFYRDRLFVYVMKLYDCCTRVGIFSGDSYGLFRNYDSECQDMILPELEVLRVSVEKKLFTVLFFNG